MNVPVLMYHSVGFPDKKELKATYERLVTQHIDQEYLYEWSRIPYKLLSILKQNKQKSIKILELGCGRGHLSNYLKENGFDVIATDLNIVSLNLAQQMFPDLEFVCADAEELPFRDNEFDGVISVELFEHLPNINKHLIEVKRVLKNGGVYMIKTPNKLIEMIYNFIYRKNWDPLHLNSQDLTSLKKLLINHGFKPTFYSSGKLTPSQIRKINNLKIRMMIEHFPIIVIPKLLQPSLTCVAKVVEE